MLRARLRRVSVACDEAVENDAASTPDAESDALAELHTLKGEARMLGLSQLSDLAHELESLLGERATRSDCSRVLRAMHGALDEGGAAGEHAGEARLEATLSELARHAEALARQLGKHLHVEMRIDGAAAAQLGVDALGPVLLHLLRNAVDHGLELPENRGSKPFVGRIAVSVQGSAGGITLQVEDDGQGVDTERLRIAAVERQILSTDQAAGLDQQQVLALLFEPALSTRSEVTALSGRGLGLDVVRRQVRAWGGRVTVDTERGRGTRFAIWVPSSRCPP
jgi:chemotaxis protein histidine kinase CheA